MVDKGPILSNAALAEPSKAVWEECEVCDYAQASAQYAVPAMTPLLRAQFAGLGGTTS